MTQIQNTFNNVVNEIIETELNDIQLQQYLIEGDEIVTSLFATNALPYYRDDKDLVFDFGISPSGMDLQVVCVGFIEIINSCFSLIKEMPATNIQDNWRSILTKCGTHDLLIELLCTKYQDQLFKLINSQ